MRNNLFLFLCFLRKFLDFQPVFFSTVLSHQQPRFNYYFFSKQIYPLLHFSLQDFFSSLGYITILLTGSSSACSIYFGSFYISHCFSKLALSFHNLSSLLILITTSTVFTGGLFLYCYHHQLANSVCFSS